MNVELVAITKPVGKLSHIPSSEFITFVARVSNPNNQTNFLTSDRLIRYLLKKAHWSPFEFVDMTFEVDTTRDIGRQILRHDLNFQEFSGRYANAIEMPFVVRECRLQDTANRQNSLPNTDPELDKEWFARQEQTIDRAKADYKWAMDNNIAKEQARAILPEGLTPTRMYMKGSVRNWFHFCLVRCHPGTQAEHRAIANSVWNIVVEQMDVLRGIDMSKLAIRYQEMFETVLGEVWSQQ